MKKVLFAVIAIIVLVAGFMVYQWNKPHKDVAGEQALPVSAVALFQAFSGDEQQANTLYLNKALAVSGKVVSVESNQDGQRYIVLQTEDALNGVMCTMRGNDFTAAAGEEVTVKGFCSGFVGDVKLTDCVLATPGK